MNLGSQEDLTSPSDSMSYLRQYPRPDTSTDDDDDPDQLYCDDDDDDDDDDSEQCSKSSINKWKTHSQDDTEDVGFNFHSPFSEASSALNPKYIDTHCHLHWLFRKQNFKGTFAKYREVYSETFPKSFEGCVNIYCDPREFMANDCWELLKEDKMWGAVGCHPRMVQFYDDEAEQLLVKTLQYPKVVALGEIGLDYSSNPNSADKELQHKIFRRQLKLAVEMQLPVVVHSRDSDADALKILRELIPHNYFIHRHCFTGDWIELVDWIKYFPNLFVGLTNLVTYPSARTLHTVAHKIPLNRLLLETDAPYFVPKNLELPTNFRWSHPGMAFHVANEVASLRWEDTVDDVLRAARQNTQKMYGI